MAKAKDTETTAPEMNTQEAPIQEAPIQEAPAEFIRDRVSVTLPRATGREPSEVFVGLNGKGYTIRRGVPVQVPRAVAQILRESQRQEERQAAFMEAQRQAAERAFGTNAL